MNFQIKKLLTAIIVAHCYTLNIQSNTEIKEPVLKCALLKSADQMGIFHAPMVDILQARIDFLHLVQGLKIWSGIILDIAIEGTNSVLKIYCRRPEIIHGASFIAISPDHEIATTIATAEHQLAVLDFIAQTTQKSLFERQIDSNDKALFTGAYGINPFTQERLPIYISDYAIECFDVRKNKTRLGVPAHNSKDLTFAHLHKLPIKIVVDVQTNAQGKKADIAAPLLDKHGHLTEAYLGEYNGCIVTGNQTLQNLSLKDAAQYVTDYLIMRQQCITHTEKILYEYNKNIYSIIDLAKFEAALTKSSGTNIQLNELKKDLKIALNYAQADFLEIGEKFLINVKNNKSLMVVLIEESCALRKNEQCYLLRWAQMKGNVNEKEIFRRDITSLKAFRNFCKDLINFLEDFAYSCPLAFENIRKQNER